MSEGTAMKNKALMQENVRLLELMQLTPSRVVHPPKASLSNSLEKIQYFVFRQ
jgi:hypothetical protein